MRINFLSSDCREITALPKLLELLDIKGRIVTAEAMHTQRASAKAIGEKGADYVVALKGNQATLYDDVKLYLDDPQAENMTIFQDVDAGHGRIERRIAHLTGDIDWLQEHHDWPALGAIGKITACRESNASKSVETRYYLLSRALSAEQFLTATRGSLVNRERAALGAGCHHERGRNAKPKRQRPGKPGHPASHRAQSCNKRTLKRLYARQTEKSRMERQFHPKSHQDNR